MSYLRRFNQGDVLQNTIKAHPEYKVVLYSSSSYINDQRFMGTGSGPLTGVIDLNEINVNRSSNYIHPFVVKDGNMWRFKSITTSSYNAELYGTQLTGAYPYTASVTREYFNAFGSHLNIAPDGTIPDVANTSPAAEINTDRKNAYFVNRKRLLALKNTMNYNKVLSSKFDFTGSYVSGSVNLLNIPKIMYGATIKKGSVNLKMFFTGTLVDEATDEKRNGEIIAKGVNSNVSGNVVGVVLYEEGIILLTGSEDIVSGETKDCYTGDEDEKINPKWLYYGSYNTGSVAPSSSLFTMDFRGTTHTPVMTMFADAEAGMINNSQNPTWASSSAGDWRKEKLYFDSGTFAEPPMMEIANTAQSPYESHNARFEKQVFISQIGIYDDDKNLIAIAKLANPVLKKETENYTFKIKLDL